MAMIKPHQASKWYGTPEELYGFRDSVSSMWLRFYSPVQRFDLWQAYVEGARRTYRQFRVEPALTIPPVTPHSAVPVFCVTTDDEGTVRSGWYVNGPLTAVTAAYAPAEFAAEPGSATLIAEWISGLIPEGVIELKGAWVDPSLDQKAVLADLAGRAILHALDLLGVRHAFCTAADHAAPRWKNSGGRTLPGVVPTPYPDDRYRTTLLRWDAQMSLEWSSDEQRQLYLDESLRTTGQRHDRSLG